MLNAASEVLYVGKAREFAGAGAELRAAFRAFGPYCADDLGNRVNDVPDHADGDRRAAAGAET